MINEKKYLIMLVLLAGLILVLPSTVRMLDHNPYMPNSEAYQNARIYAQGDARYDSLEGHSIPVNIINYVRLGEYARQILFNIVPIILGLLSVALIYLVLLKQNISEKTVLAIVILIIASPIFNYAFTDFKVYSYVIFLNVLGLYLLFDEKIMLGSAAFALIPFIDLLSGILTLLILLIYMFAKGKNVTDFKIISLVLLTSVILAGIVNIYTGYNIMRMFTFGLHNIITDIGALIGISFSIIILTTIGMMLLWENGWRNLITYILIILFILASLFNDKIRIYMNFVIMIYAGFAFMYLNKRKWSISIIKKTTVLLIICSIFFSSLVYITKVTRSEPTPEYVDGLKFMKNQSLPTEVIFASPNNAQMIEYFSERMVYSDDSKRFDSDFTMENISTSRNLERTEKMLKEHNIKYIIIDEEFEPYLIQTDGLLFLIETSQKFTSIYKNERIQIWMYNG